ncbi:hypothetical protein RND71_034891 [Anisodus tanguticus]|uniref:Uncharacterized protein n=1 Tax=Anisodus tanguticus TaxID=243964 RepID=A0AAE1R3T3_9SOLA|nr:hypothetical protein RND71_034891 [Anisodus tanguticus]
MKTTPFTYYGAVWGNMKQVKIAMKNLTNKEFRGVDQKGVFITAYGLQLHTDEFDYPGCTFAYQEFVKSVVAYQKKLNISLSVSPLVLNISFVVALGCLS